MCNSFDSTLVGKTGFICQESSTLVDESVPPERLESRTVQGIAKYLAAHDDDDGGLSGGGGGGGEGRRRRRRKAGKKIVVLTGAGISTSAGIPDFRSPDTGLYANLARLDLPYAEAVFDISYFRQNPLPFYTLAHELYPGKYRPTITHSFLRLLADKGLLLKCFTQNIDCLEREAGVPGDLIVEAHGSFATHSCIECRSAFPDDAMHSAVLARTVPHCQSCDGLVKPNIVFFGESLPRDFVLNSHLPGAADLCIIIGTSLSVHPFASLPQMVGESVPRLLINNDRAGTLGTRRDDVLLLGDCDAGVRKLAEACGWLDELEQLWERTDSAASSKISESPASTASASASAGITATATDASASKESQGTEDSRDTDLEQKIDHLTTEIDKTLRWSEEYRQRTLVKVTGSGSGSDSLAKGSDRNNNNNNENHENSNISNDKDDGGKGFGSGKADGSQVTGLAHVFPHMHHS